MMTFNEIHDHEVQERYRALVYLAAFLIATLIIVASVTSVLVG